MKKQLEREPLAIIGMACRFPMADDPDQFWANILNGRDCITDIPAGSHWDPADYYDPDPKRPDHTYARRGGFLKPQAFEPLKYGIPPKSLEATDTSQLVGLMVAREAMEDAGYGQNRDFDRERVSCILGVTGTLELVIPLGARLGHPVWRKALLAAGLDEARTEELVQRIADGFVPWQEQSFPGLLGNVVAGRIANYLDLGGTNCVSDAACASALAAVNLAAMELWSGKADMVLTGGIDTFNDIFMYMCFSKTPALSPSGDARPFSAEGDGTILGEGAGLLVLKRLAEAERDGDRILATLRSVGSSSDGKGNAIYAPSARGQIRALRRAYQAAGVDPREIGLIEGHGTGTKVGDAVEVGALGEVFGSAEGRGPWGAVGSVKSQIGHTKAAAGAAGLIKAVLSLRHGVLPPTLKVDRPLEHLLREDGALFLNDAARPWVAGPAPRRAGVSAFGFGGSNFHCVVEAYPAQTEIFWDGQVQILAFTGANRAQLRQRLEHLDVTLAWEPLRDLAAAQLRQFTADAPFRLLLLVEEGKTDLARIRANALNLLEKFSDRDSWNAPEGIFFGHGPRRGKLGLLFPGQGSQYCHMLRDLACRFPVMRKVLADVDKAFADCEDFGDEGPLTRLIYPPSCWGDEDAKRHEEVLRRTEHAQPAIGAVSIGLLKVLDAFGVVADAAAGHSYGEIPALCASERFDADALYLLSRLRGKLMASGDGDRGAMLAVRAPLAKVEALVAEQGFDLVLANKNAPDQIVLSGATAEIERAARQLHAAGMRSKRLPVAAAFHSTLVAQASQPFFAELQKVNFMEAQKPVYSNTTGLPYPTQPEDARNLLANQLSKPVEFVQEIRNMFADGVDTFLEVGPGARLTGLVKSILEGTPHEAMAVDASSGKRLGTFDLARVLAHLASLGHDLDLSRWENAATRQARPIPAKASLIVPISGANYVSEETRAAARRPLAPILATPVSAPAPSAAPTPTHEVPHLSSAASAQPPQASAPAALPAHVTELIEASQRNIAVLQKLQEDTARLHAQFLQGQESANRTLLALVQQQQQAMFGGNFAMPQVVPAPALTRPVAPAPPVAAAVAAAPVAQVAPAPLAAPVVAAVALDAPAPAASAAFSATLMRVIAAKTGYPVDMLEPQMALDADLGIDSIKRVEIFSALHEAEPRLPVLEPDRIGRIATLAEIIALVPQEPTAGVAASPARPRHDSATVTAALLRIVTEKTGYPAEMLDPGMSMDGDLGIDSIKRVEIFSALQESLPGLPAVEPDRMGSFVSLADIVNCLASAAPVVKTVPVAAAPIARAVPAGPASDQAEHALRAVVAEKTGYPEDMLDMTMSLDGDLGVDSIKRVEILSALAERLPNLPEIKPDRAASFRTLGEIVAALSATAPAPAAAPQVSAGAGRARIEQALLAVVAEKTGYPAEMLDPAMNLEGDLGIDSIKRVEILSGLAEALPGLREPKPDELGGLHTLAEIIAWFDQGAAAPTSTPPVAVTRPLATRQPAALERSIPCLVPLREQAQALRLREGASIWILDSGDGLGEALRQQFSQRGCSVALGSATELRALSVPARLDGLLLLADATCDEAHLRGALMLVSKLATHLRAAGDQGFLTTLTRLDGQLGFAGTSANPLQGALAGLAKTAAHEFADLAVRALDLAPELSTATALERALPLITSRGAVEVGIHAEGLVTVALEQRPVTATEQAPFGRGDVVLVSGGARGVTAACALELARRFQPTLILLGSGAAPDEQEPAWAANLHTEAELKQALLARSPDKRSPKELQADYRAFREQREKREMLAAMRQSGATVHYQQLDLRDGAAVATTVAELRQRFGAIRGLVHGAGVLADRRIEDKTEEQFDLVFGTKARGLQHLLTATAADPLTAVALFSSSTGRFGRTGQVDYAMANEVLNKTAATLRTSRPTCRTVAVNWGPWDGGMVTPELKNLFASEGIGVIDIEAGARYLADELTTATDGPAEIVILGQVDQPASAPAAPIALGELEEVFGLELSLDSHPFLRSHVIGGKAVLPAVMMIEWCSHAAMIQQLGYQFAGFRNFRVLKGITLGAGESVALHFAAGTHSHQAGELIVPVQLFTRDEQRKLPRCQIEVVLNDAGVQAAEAPRLQAPTEAWKAEEAVYETLFHGPHFQGIESIDGCSARAIAVTAAAAPLADRWMAEPLRRSWLADPLVLDCAFQMMVLWGVRQHGVPSLPVAVERLRLFGRFPRRPNHVRLVGAVRESGRNKALCEIEIFDTEGALIARLEGYECVLDASLHEAYRSRFLLQEVAN